MGSINRTSHIPEAASLLQHVRIFLVQDVLQIYTVREQNIIQYIMYIKYIQYVGIIFYESNADQLLIRFVTIYLEIELIS